MVGLPSAVDVRAKGLGAPRLLTRPLHTSQSSERRKVKTGKKNEVMTILKNELAPLLRVQKGFVDFVGLASDTSPVDAGLDDSPGDARAARIRKLVPV